MPQLCPSVVFISFMFILCSSCRYCMASTQISFCKWCLYEGFWNQDCIYADKAVPSGSKRMTIIMIHYDDWHKNGNYYSEDTLSHDMYALNVCLGFIWQKWNCYQKAFDLQLLFWGLPFWYTVCLFIGTLLRESARESFSQWGVLWAWENLSRLVVL